MSDVYGISCVCILVFILVVLIALWNALKDSLESKSEKYHNANSFDVYTDQDETKMERIDRLLCEHAKHIAAYRNESEIFRKEYEKLNDKVKVLEQKLDEIYIEE